MGLVALEFPCTFVAQKILFFAKNASRKRILSYEF